MKARIVEVIEVTQGGVRRYFTRDGESIGVGPEGVAAVEPLLSRSEAMEIALRGDTFTAEWAGRHLPPHVLCVAAWNEKREDEETDRARRAVGWGSHLVNVTPDGEPWSEVRARREAPAPVLDRGDFIREPGEAPPFEAATHRDVTTVRLPEGHATGLSAFVALVGDDEYVPSPRHDGVAPPFDPVGAPRLDVTTSHQARGEGAAE